MAVTYQTHETVDGIPVTLDWVCEESEPFVDGVATVNSRVTGVTFEPATLADVTRAAVIMGKSVL